MFLAPLLERLPRHARGPTPPWRLLIRARRFQARYRCANGARIVWHRQDRYPPWRERSFSACDRKHRHHRARLTVPPRTITRQSSRAVLQQAIVVQKALHHESFSLDRLPLIDGKLIRCRHIRLGGWNADRTPWIDLPQPDRVEAGIEAAFGHR